MNAPTIRMETLAGIGQMTDSLTILFVDAGQPNATQTQAPDTPAGERNGKLRDGQIVAINRYGGHISKTLGNSMMAEFSDAASAVRAAIEMQRLVRDSNYELPPGECVGLRIGIHTATGMPGIALFGGTVNMAAAITIRAAVEQILISEPVFEAISQESDIQSSWLGPLAPEGGSQRQDVFEVQWTGAPAGIPPRYEVLAQLGAGGMGVVYKVRDLEAGEIVALKILKAGIASDPAMQENLRLEVCLSRKVTHKNVCRIHEFGRSQGTAYISMEFVEGESLLARLRRTGAMPWQEVVSVARQIYAGLREAHAQGIVHRDLKPANIMLCPGNGAVKIMDFGIARSFQHAAQVTCTMVGTPAYMSPEQVEMKRGDARTDIYSLGLVLYEMATGTPAFEGDTPIAVALKQLNEYPTCPSELAAGLPAYAEAVMLKCLQKDAAKRYGSVDELEAALEPKPNVRPAASIWGDFVADMRGAYVDVRGSAGLWITRAFASVRTIDWESLAANRKMKSSAIGVGLGLALSGIGIFAMHGVYRSSSIKPVSLGSATGSSAEASPIPVASVDAREDRTRAEVAGAESVHDTRAISSHSIDLIGDSRHVTSPIAPVVSTGAASATAKPKEDKLFAKPHTDTKSGAKDAAPRLTASRAASADAAEPAGGNATAANDSGTTRAESQPQDSAPQETATFPDINAAPMDKISSVAARESDDSVALPSGAPRYFEVGTFKDSAWADQAVQKLTELGFHAKSVHKMVLWAHSYQVRVGPYSDTKSMSEAGMQLTEHGFKPHPIK